MVSIEDTIAGPIGGRITDMATAWGALITATDIRATAATAIQATPVMGDMGIRPTGMADWVDCAGGDTDMHLTASSQATHQGRLAHATNGGSLHACWLSVFAVQLRPQEFRER
jgi:hypothetical protein